MTKPRIESELGAKHRFEQVVDRMLNTPPKKHEPLKPKKKSAKKARAKHE